MVAKGAFPNLLGGDYALDPIVELFIPGIDGEPEFPTLNQRWRSVEEIDETDVLDVMENGVIEPLIIRKRKDGRGEVIDGRQRGRWARIANERLVSEGAPPHRLRCILQDKSTTTEVVAQRKMMSANYHRVDPSVMQKSEDAWNRCALLGETDPQSVSLATLKQVAVTMRCSPNAVRNYLKLQLLVPEVQAMAAKREITLNALVALAGMPEDEQETKAKTLRDAKQAGATSAQIVEAARSARDQSEAESGSGVTATDKVKVGKASAGKPGKAPPPPEDDGALKPLRPGQVRAMLRLALADIEAGAGAGKSLNADVIKLLKIINGDAKPATLKGVTELLGRIADGE
jgi:ParB-like chromosome segregation protein Spo0J